MKKMIYLSFACIIMLQAAEVELGTIEVKANIDSEVVKDVSGEDIKSADLAEALFQQSPTINIIRRSGVANDIIMRGMKKDNINVTIDGAKIYGACPNRMDPPVSHVLTNNVDYVELIEGPFNIEDFGVLSGDVKVHTIKPEKDFHGELNLGAGSWDFKKAALKMSGGTQKVRFLLSASTERSGQYKDGNGDDFVGQIQRNIDAGIVPASAQYQPKYQNMDAYSKDTLMAKLFWDITDNQELRLSYTANRSDNVLYPNSKMDAVYDDSDIYNMEYTVKNIGTYSKELKLQAYRSEVEHPMSTRYRNSAAMLGYEMTHKLTTQTEGIKLKNRFDVANHTVTVGADYSLRNWDGGYYKNGTPLPSSKFHSIYDVDTKNSALFIKDEIKMSNALTLEAGLRYDDTSITSQNRAQQDNDYNELNGYLLGTYTYDSQTKYFMGLGRSSRVPDAKELYWIGSMGNPIGTPTLDDTVNYEFDVGIEKTFDNATFKLKAFYSKLDNFIAYNASKTTVMMGKTVAFNAYENVDATLYGFEIKGTYVSTESLYFDYGLAYQRGEKSRPLTGQTGKNMPNIVPLKVNLAANYDFTESFNVKAEVIAGSRWDRIDKENGEQELPGYAVLNLKGTKTFGKNIELSVGVDNVMDKTYAVSNTYKDLILLTTGGDNIMKMNEPGRYIYANLKYKF